MGFVLIGCPAEDDFSPDPLKGSVYNLANKPVSSVFIITSTSGYILPNTLGDMVDSTRSNVDGTYYLERGFPAERREKTGCFQDDEEYLGMIDFFLIFTHSEYDTLITLILTDSSKIVKKPYFVDQADTIFILPESVYGEPGTTRKFPSVYLTKKELR